MERGLRMKDQLIHMRDKLNNISRSNRSIRLLKLYNKWSFDLTELDGYPMKKSSVLQSLNKSSANLKMKLPC